MVTSGRDGSSTRMPDTATADVLSVESGWGGRGTEASSVGLCNGGAGWHD
jgi:hypothetical protein